MGDVPPPKGRVGRGRPHSNGGVANGVPAPDFPKAGLPQPKRPAAEADALGLPTLVVSFGEEASLEAQAASVASKIAELQSVHESLLSELAARSRVKQLSSELAAVTAQCADLEAAAFKSNITWQEKIQEVQERLWAADKRGDALAHQVQTLEEDVRRAEGRAAAEGAAAGERQRVVESLQALLEARDRALAAKEQQLMDSHHSMAKVGPPQIEPPPWGWPAPLGLPSRPPGSDDLNGGSNHHAMANLLAQAAQVQAQRDGGQGGGGGPPPPPGPAPFYPPPGLMHNSPALLAHHHGMWPPPQQQAAPPPPTIFGDFPPPHGEHTHSFVMPPPPGMWPVAPQAPVQAPQHAPPVMSVAPPAAATQAAAPEAPTERRTIVRTPMPPSAAPTPPAEVAPPPRPPRSDPADFGASFQQPPKPRGGGGGGGGRRNGRGASGNGAAPTQQQASPVLMF